MSDREKSSSRLKLFIENIVIYGLGGIISKIIPLLMLPILTRLYPSSSNVGLNDLFITLSAFATNIALLGMYDAMFRFFFDSNEFEYQKKICSTSLVCVAVFSVIVSIAVLVLRKPISVFVFGDEKYISLVYIAAGSVLIGCINTIMSAPTRINNQRKVYLLINTIFPIITYSVAICLVLRGFYIIAIPLAGVVASLMTLICYSILNRKWFNWYMFSGLKLKEMLLYGIPLMPVFLVYWLYNSSDKIMINMIIGTEWTGVYSIAAKMGSISNLIYMAFAGGWLFFSYSTMKDEDQIQMKSHIFEYLGVISFTATILMMVVSKTFFNILFPEEYLSGYLVAPYLFISPLLLMLFQTAANQFSILKKSYYNLIALIIGAFFNLALNYLLIPTIGIEGAAIATLVGYVTSVVICVILLCHKKRFKIYNRFLFSTLLLLIYFVGWRAYLHTHFTLASVSAIIPLGFYILLYKQDIIYVVKKIKPKNREKEI